MGKDNAVSKYQPTEQDLAAFLSRLAAVPEEAAEIYNKVHKKLIYKFESHRNAAPFAIELADETMDRAVCLGALEETIKNADAYVRQIGEFVLKEFWKRPRAETPVAEVPEAPQIDERPDDRQVFLEECLDKLPPADRELVLNYHLDKGAVKIAGHREAAARLNRTQGALRVRMSRARDSLEECVETAVKNSRRRNVLRNHATPK